MQFMRFIRVMRVMRGIRLIIVRLIIFFLIITILMPSKLSWYCVSMSSPRSSRVSIFLKSRSLVPIIVRIEALRSLALVVI